MLLLVISLSILRLRELRSNREFDINLKFVCVINAAGFCRRHCEVDRRNVFSVIENKRQEGRFLPAALRS